MTPKVRNRDIEILLVEDSSSDAQLMMEALSELNLHQKLRIVNNGVEALNFLRHPCSEVSCQRPDLILLDLNLPKLSGREVLAQIKTDPELKIIPVVILTTSSAAKDILQSYQLHANGYIIKPLDLDEFIASVQSLVHFWLATATLPSDAATR